MVRERRTRKVSDEREIESYEYGDQTRLNNPPVGLVTAGSDPDSGKKTYAYDPHLDPQLAWAGKAEHTSFEVPTVSLHVHERIDPCTIVEALRRRPEPVEEQQLSLFEQPAENPPLREAIDFYKHPHGWSNRLIAGDSLLVMNSLLEKEGLAGQVQMVYIDPPYGIRYGSNFQPFINNREVSSNDRDEDLTQEPETIRAFRDTWELEVHSYLAYLRDRLRLAHSLLSDSGSCFVQISDENLHLIRNLLDEIFGAHNMVVTIPVKKKGSQKSSLIDPVNDYLVWYTKTSRYENAGGVIKFRPLFERWELDNDTLNEFRTVQLLDGRQYPLTAVPDTAGTVVDYRLDPKRLFRDHVGARLFRLNPLTSGGERKNQSLPYQFEGKTYSPGKGNCWKTTVQTDDGTTPGMDRLASAGRLAAGRGQLRFKSYLDDFGYKPISNWWDGLGGASDPIYVVQTNAEIIQRCVLMTTDPGDLVLDPTCGSGTTAAVAEQWGRRWITCDTSRVSIALAKQRVMTAAYEYYQLAHREEGISSGFVYTQVPHIELQYVARGEPAPLQTLYDRPLRDRAKVRVTGPFTVEAVPAPGVLPVDELDAPPVEADASVARGGPTLREAEWRDELLKAGIRGKGGQTIQFTRVEPLPGTRFLHADAETRPAGNQAAQRAVISFGPSDAPLEQRQVERAWEEARTLSPKPGMLVFAAFQFDPEAAKDIDELTPEKTGMTFLKVQMNADLLTEDLKKKRSSNESFWLIGQPDVRLLQERGAGSAAAYRVEVHGFDYYNTRSGEIDSGGPARIALWMLDIDYDGRSLFPRQVFFPMVGEQGGWARLARTLKAEIDEERIEFFRGTVSLPFAAGAHRRAAVKIVDDRGIESLKIIELGG